MATSTPSHKTACRKSFRPVQFIICLMCQLKRACIKSLFSDWQKSGRDEWPFFASTASTATTTTYSTVIYKPGGKFWAQHNKILLCGRRDLRQA